MNKSSLIKLARQQCDIMKKVICIGVIILLVTAGCGENKQSTDDLVVVDVTKNYPKKEIILQDIFDVEYIPLETTDEFITQGLVVDVGKEVILVKNGIRDGDIFFFDRNGKGIRKINRMGQGNEEYIYIHDIILDENNREISVNDNSRKKIIVYDLNGAFKRNINHKEDVRYADIYNFNKECFIWRNSVFDYDINDAAAETPSFFITSKQDGSITKEIKITFEHRKATILMQTDEASGTIYVVSPSFSSIIPFQGQIALVEPSSDTVYIYSPDHDMMPFIARTPSIHSMDPEVFLFPKILTDQYYFMQTAKKEFDFETRQGVPSIELMYDRKEKSIFEYTVYNDDYSNKKYINIPSHPLSNEIAFYVRLEAYELVEAYNEGLLKGKLKEIAAGLDEDDNPVIMFVKHKKSKSE